MSVSKIVKAGENARIIWSADGLTYDQIVEIVKDPNFPHNRVAVKFDLTFLLDKEKNPQHLDVIDILQHDYHVPVFVDAKIMEVKSKVLALTSVYLRYHPWMLSAVGSICNTGVAPSEENDKDAFLEERDVLCEFAELCLDVGTAPCVVTVLTDKTSELIAMEYNGRLLKNQVLMYARLAAKCGVTNIVCPGLVIDALREDEDACGLKLNVPGVRLPNDNKHEQKQIMTPGEAIKKGADRLVIGRALSDDDGTTFTSRLRNITDNVFFESGIVI